MLYHLSYMKAVEHHLEHLSNALVTTQNTLATTYQSLETTEITLAIA